MLGAQASQQSRTTTPGPVAVENVNQENAKRLGQSLSMSVTHAPSRLRRSGTSLDAIGR